MSSLDWNRARPLLEQAIELPPERRVAFVREQCADDPPLADRILRLLQRDDGFEASLGDDSSELETEWLDPPPPERVGPWAVDRLLATGGMGTVWLGHRADDQFEKQVAIKFVRRGVHGDEARSLFLRERQLLAGLEHPGIARLIDGGVCEDGRPYLVMEFVEGRPIDRYCIEEKLDLRERIELLREVSTTVGDLHARAVVHRDLKPSNVLVTRDGEPKLLDFGIARVLRAPGKSSEETITVERRLTPGYASPEQVLGKPLGPPTDVYSLGVMLFELLTGARPHRIEGRSPTGLERAICEEEPERPSTHWRRASAEERRQAPTSPARLDRALRGELDAIVSVALRKEAERRYGDAGVLARDLEHWLEGMPVTARPDSIAYRWRKRIARHPRVALAGAAAAVALGIAGALAIDFARESDRAWAAAEERTADVQLSVRSLIDLHDRLWRQEGTTAVRRELVDTARTTLERIAPRDTNDPELLFEMLRAWRRTGLVQGDPAWDSLGDTAAAMESFDRAHEIGRRLALLGEPRPEVLEQCALLCGDRAAVAIHQGELIEALEEYRRGLEFARSIPESAAALRAGCLASLLPDYTDHLANLGRWDEVGDARRQATESARLFFESEPVETGLGGLRLAEMHQRRARSAVLGQGLAAAIEEHRLALEVLDELPTPEDGAVRRRRTSILASLGRMLTERGELVEARIVLEEALAPAEESVRAEPTSRFARNQAAGVHGALAALCSEEEEFAAGVEHRRQALEHLRQVASPESPDRGDRRALAEYSDWLGKSLRKAKHFEQAREAHLEALASFELLARNPADWQARRDLSVCHYFITWTLVLPSEEEERPAAERIELLTEAREHLLASRAILQAMAGEGSLKPGDEVFLGGMGKTGEEFGKTLVELREQLAGE